ncbi:MAG: hypothetical protein V3W41_22450 [Planctomycetota bacterium]
MPDPIPAPDPSPAPSPAAALLTGDPAPAADPAPAPAADPAPAPAPAPAAAPAEFEVSSLLSLMSDDEKDWIGKKGHYKEDMKPEDIVHRLVAANRNAEIRLSADPETLMTRPTEEDLASTEYWQKNFGAPTEVGGYKREDIAGTDSAPDEKFMDAMLDVGVKNGIPQRQMAALWQGATEFVEKAAAAETEATLVDQKAVHDKMLETLKTSWGAETDKNIRIGKEALYALFDPKEQESLIAGLNKAMGDDAEMVKMFHKIGSMMTEDQRKDGAVHMGLGKTPAGAAAELKALHDDPVAKKALADASDPRHKEFEEKRTRLVRIKNAA